MDHDNRGDLLYRIPRGPRKRMNYDYGVFSPFEVSADRSHQMHFNIYLFGPIEDASQFIPALEVFQHAGEGDLIDLHLSTPGGSMDATDTFLQAMRNCEADIVVRASGGVHSCGSIILLHADKFTLSHNFNSLIHNGSAGNGGDLNKFAAASKYTVEHMTRVLRNTYEGFLTPDELNAMIDGKDFWLDGAEWMRRWHLRQEYFIEKLKAQGITPPKPRRKKNQPQG